MDHPVTLHVEFGPVESFVAEARRTRDVWAGSYILSYLMAHALHAAIGAGLVLKQPSVASNALYQAVAAQREGAPLPPLGIADRVGTLPDRFEGQAQSVEGATAIAHTSIAAWFAAWHDLTEAVWRYLENKRWPATTATRALWDAQVGDVTHRVYWRALWTIGSYEAHLRRWNFQPFDGLTDQIGEKSTLSGERSALRGEGLRRQEVRTFWEQMSRRLGPYEVRPNGGERLDAINLVKRLFPYVAKDVLGWDVRISYPSTRAVAIAPWLDAILQHKDEDLALLVFEVADRLQKAGAPRANYLSVSAPLQALTEQHIFAEDAAQLLTYDGDLFFPDSHDTWSDLLGPTPTSAVLEARTAVEKFMECSRTLSIRQPSNFFAILAMDGDSLGALLARAPEIQAPLSDALGRFAKHVPEIVEAADALGQTLYAGGDDVLAFLPMETALDVAERLAILYRQTLQPLVGTKGGSVTISAGILYAPVATPLTVLLRRVHSLLHEVAKEELGRDAFAVEVWKSGGPILTTGRSWDWTTPAGQAEHSQTIRQIHWAADELRKGDRGEGFSNKLFYKLPKLAEVVAAGSVPIGFRQQVDLVLAEHVANRTLTLDVDRRAAREHVEQLVTLLRGGSSGQLEWPMARFIRFLTERRA